MGIQIRADLSLRQSNERRRYKVTPSLIGWAQTYNQPCIYMERRSLYWDGALATLYTPREAFHWRLRTSWLGIAELWSCNSSYLSSRITTKFRTGHDTTVLSWLMQNFIAIISPLFFSSVFFFKVRTFLLLVKRCPDSTTIETLECLTAP